ncbi:hypothetical protein F5J12DRAFT_531736 [Pisolithus orientalis]|uniref:uncharacterized protein n=1 Tax=Pisolithus orientalis TaxID=936130 RepID=UPI002224DDAA|nr:uncharacterized protein F5J12DRAFT_531736 [Pisolithus orientalis]KAI5987983.1 hypothetical protein F5J12DRAFT_531736 [Pisolithus orientalis]
MQYSRSIDVGRCIEYDRQLDFHSMVREMEVLQAKPNAIEDEDEQRALEEDVTGKILWLCWCGICAEVDQLLPQVADYIRSERKFVGLRAILNSLMTGPLANPSDDQVHLQRILFDAGAGTSKHQLLLAARAAEQAKWSGTIVPWDTNTNMQGPSTSFQTPPTPAV